MHKNFITTCTYACSHFFHVWQSLEIQHGAILALGHLIGQLLRKQRLESAQGGSLWQKVEKSAEQAVVAIGTAGRQLFILDVYHIKIFT